MNTDETRHLYAAATAVMEAGDAPAIEATAAPLSRQPGQALLPDKDVRLDLSPPDKSAPGGRSRRRRISIVGNVPDPPLDGMATNVQLFR
jgi:hypothetical protein